MGVRVGVGVPEVENGDEENDIVGVLLGVPEAVPLLLGVIEGVPLTLLVIELVGGGLGVPVGEEPGEGVSLDVEDREWEEEKEG